MERPTIRDIAREAGVSVTAVSFVLNDKPGISEKTRDRILATASRLGWVPSARAQALSLAKSDVIGLFIARDPESYGSERFFFNFMVGLQETLTAHKYDLLFHNGATLGEEMVAHRKWWAGRKVDGVVVVDPIINDPRVKLLESIGLPAVYVGASVEHSASIVTPEREMIVSLAAHLQSRGAKRIAYIAGKASLQHTHERIAALQEFAREAGVAVMIQAQENPTEKSGCEAVARLFPADGSSDLTDRGSDLKVSGVQAGECSILNISSAELSPDAEYKHFTPSEFSPDGIIFDNEILALGGVSALHSANKIIGADVLVCSCEDSSLCRVTSPQITSVNRDPAELGRDAAQLLLEVLSGKAPRRLIEPAPSVIIRSSTERLHQ